MKQFTNGRQAATNFAELYGKKKLSQIRRYEQLVRTFKKQHKSAYCYLASSSGRVELVGNHTDHNGGKVVGCTVDLDIVAAFLPNDTGTVSVCGNGYRDIRFKLDEIHNLDGGSTGMVKGVLAGLQNRGKNIGGFDALLNSTLPSGAGISSSAAFQLLIASIQNALYNNNQIDPRTLAEVGQYAENVYFNKPCGLLDQGVIAVGGVVAIDFADGFSETRLGSNLLGLNLVVVDTGKSHSNLTQHYAAIPAEMKSVAQAFGKQRLVEVDEQQFFARREELVRQLGERPVLRAKHFFEENHRVEQVGEALRSGNVSQLLQAVNDSGQSSIHQLQNCHFDDDRTVADAVEYARKICPNGASRVHGGGFAGTILAVVSDADLPDFVSKMSAVYGKNSVRPLKVRQLGATVL